MAAVLEFLSSNHEVAYIVGMVGFCLAYVVTKGRNVRHVQYITIHHEGMKRK